MRRTCSGLRRVRGIGVILAVLFGLSQGAILSRGFSPQGSLLVLTNVHVIDGVSAEPLRDATVLIGDGKIREIVKGRLATYPTGATVLDLRGMYLLPGLIDAHVHMSTIEQAQTALRSGVTTVRSMGISHYADVGLRELARSGRLDLPEVLAAGYHVRPRLAPEIFLDEPALADLMDGVRGVENVRRVVQANLKRRVDVIKVLATERAGLPETDPRRRTFTDEELAAVVEEARRGGVPVAAHAHGDEGAAAAVRAGVKSIEHGTYLSDRTLALMKERGTYLVPTIAVVQDLLDPGGQYTSAALQARGRHMLPRLRETVQKAWKAGVKIVAATDGSYQRTSWLRLQHDMEEMVRSGMPPLAAIQAATLHAAELLGIAHRTGTIKVGWEADLIVVERDPLEDIVAVQDVLLVINNGKIVLNRLE